VEQKTQLWIQAAIPTWFLTKVPKTYDGEKTASSTNVDGKTGYLPTENFHPVLVSTQSGSRTLFKTWNFEASARKSREYAGTDRIGNSF
jgi:hypothetical protein